MTLYRNQECPPTCVLLTTVDVNEPQFPTGNNYTDWQKLHRLATITPTGNNYTDWQQFYRLATLSQTGNNFTDWQQFHRYYFQKTRDQCYVETLFRGHLNLLHMPVGLVMSCKPRNLGNETRS